MQKEHDDEGPDLPPFSGGAIFGGGSSSSAIEAAFCDPLVVSVAPNAVSLTTYDDIHFFSTTTLGISNLPLIHHTPLVKN